MAELNNPHISSRIIDNSQTFTTDESNTKLFVPFTADKGLDNKVVLTTTSSEFEFRYSKANIKKHGQAAYNAINWLDANGGVYGMRLMPDNAGYSHAIINVQTKKSFKQVKDATGRLVDFDNVVVRPTVMYSKSNQSLDQIQYELDADHEKSIDGYDNHTLMAVVPVGRGKYYDRYAFRLSPTTIFDETYDFRVYNFEVIELKDNGSYELVEGPFPVSLLPEAISANNETMFIKDYVNTYSEYFQIVFSEKTFDKLTELYNNEANASVGSIDLLSGTTRQIGDGAETYFSEVTKKDEDVHISLHKYIDGEVVLENGQPKLNFVEVSDIQKSVVDIDDTYRQDQASVTQSLIDLAKTVLSKFRQGAYSTFVDSYVAPGTGKLGVALRDVQDKYAEVQQSEADFLADPSDAKFALLEQDLSQYSQDFKKLLKVLTELLTVVRSVGETTDVLDLLVDLVEIRQEFDLIDVSKIQAVAYKEDVLKVKNELALSKLSVERDVKVASLADTLVTVEDVIKFTKSIDEVTETESDLYSEEMLVKYAELAELYSEITDEYTLEANVESLIQNAMPKADEAVSHALKLIDLALTETVLKSVKDVHAKTLTTQLSAQTAVDGALLRVLEADTPAEKQFVMESIKQVIDKLTVEVKDAEKLLYNVELRELTDIIKLGNGSEGDLDESNPKLRAKTIKELTIRAFKGLIDPVVNDKNLLPIDLVLDANYDVDVKNAISKFVTEIRDDFMFIADTGLTASPAQALDFRKAQFNVDTNRVAIFTQDFGVFDENLGRDIRVTTPYFLASKIPANDVLNGVHKNFVGPRRGIIDGFKTVSFNPSETWKNELYKNQINYVETDTRRTKLGSQLTAQRKVTALSDINNVRTILRIQREVEVLMSEYQFEDKNGKSTAISDANYELNNYLGDWVSVGACETASGEVYSSEIDNASKKLRTRIEVTFPDVIETVLIDIVVNR